MNSKRNSSEEFTSAAEQQFDGASYTAEFSEDYRAILKVIDTNSQLLDGLLEKLASGDIPSDKVVEIAQEIAVCRQAEKELIQTAVTHFQVTEEALSEALWSVEDECSRAMQENEKLHSELIDVKADRVMLEQELVRRDDKRRVEVAQMAERLAHTEIELSKTQKERDQYHDAAFKDPLTSLPNRLGFIGGLVNRVQETIDSPDNLETAVVFIDLDGFKQLNDNCGHDIGDEALIEIAERLQNEFARKDDMVARLGGDEMVIFISYDERKFDHDHICQKIRDSLFGLYYEKNNEIFPIGASIGIAMLDKHKITDEPLEDQVSELLSEADQKMYRNKWGVDEDGNVLLNNPNAPKYQRLEKLRELYSAPNACLKLGASNYTLNCD